MQSYDVCFSDAIYNIYYIVTQQIKSVSYPPYTLLYRGHCPYYSRICCGIKAQTIMGHGEISYHPCVHRLLAQV